MASAPPQGWTDRMNFRKAIPPQGGGLTPSFWLPFADLGNGVVETTEYRTNATPTFTRATVAWARKSDGIWVSVASGSPRAHYNADGSYAGFLCEVATTNRCLYSRDLTNVAWVPVNVTPLKTQTGIDGVVNSCSIITADLDAGTILQTVVNASATRTYSAWIKRSVGTGTLEMTVDGVTWTAVTSSVGVGSFGLCQITQAAVTNPIMGFRIGTAGDAFIVDMCQEESKSVATTPIPDTDGSAETRNADVLTYPIGNISNTAGAIYAEATLLTAAAIVGVSRVLVGSSGSATSGQLRVTQSATALTTVDGTNTVNSASMSMSGLIKGACTWGGSTMLVAARGAVAVSGNFDGDFGSTTAIQIGADSGAGTRAIYGAVKNVKIFNRKLSASQLSALTA